MTRTRLSPLDTAELYNELINGFYHTGESYPPYNVIKVDDDTLVLEMALAGFVKKDIEVLFHDQVVTVASKASKPDECNYLHKGIARRSFTAKFRTGFNLEDATLEDGMLRIRFKRPEDQKPRVVSIN